MSKTEQEIIAAMSKAKYDLDDRTYDRLYAELQRVRATNRWKGIK